VHQYIIIRMISDQVRWHHHSSFALRIYTMRLRYSSRQFRDSCSQTKRFWLIMTNTGTCNYLSLEYILCMYNICATHRCRSTYTTTLHSPTTWRDVFSSMIWHIAPRVFDDCVSPGRNTHGLTTMFMFNVWDARDVYGKVDGTYSSGSKDNARDFTPPTKH